MSKMNNNVAQKGANAYLQQVDADRRLPLIKFTPMHCYYRAFLKYATKDGKRTGMSAEYIFNELPSHVLIGELLGEPVYNPLDEENTREGWVVPSEKNCIGVLKDLAQNIINAGGETDGDSSEEDTLNHVAEKMEMKPEWIKHFVEKLGEKIKETRPEYENFTIKDLVSLGGGSKFQSIIQPLLEQIVVTFSKIRTDLATWVAMSQVVSFPEDSRFHQGSLKSSEEDDGEQLKICYRMSSLCEEIAMHDFMESEEGKSFTQPDMSNKAYRDAFNKWSTAPKKNRVPWTRPKDNPVHFCFDSECNLDKKSLVVDNQTKQPKFTFGFFKSSLGANGKMNKILGASQTGTANDDPDVIELFFGFTSSEDPQLASQGMSVSDISLPNVLKQEDVESAFRTLALDTNKKKVRMYDEFAMGDCLVKFRDYVIKKKVLDWIDVSKHSEAFDILGIKVDKVDAEDIASSLYNNTTSTVSTTPVENPVASALQQAATMAQQPAMPGQVSGSNPMPVPTPAPVSMGNIPGNIIPPTIQ